MQLQHHDEHNLRISHLQTTLLQPDGHMAVPFIQNDCRNRLSTSFFCQYAHVRHAVTQDEDAFVHQLYQHCLSIFLLHSDLT